MKNILFAAAVCALMIITTPAYSGSSSETRDETLISNQELSVAIQNDQYRYIVIQYESKSDVSAVVWFTQLQGSKELPENKIGPRFVRTKKLRKNGDQKRIVLTSANTDQLIIHVEQGTVRIRVNQSNTR